MVRFPLGRLSDHGVKAEPGHERQMQTLRILLTPETEGEGTNVTLLTCWTWLDRTRGLRFELEQARQRHPLLGVVELVQVQTSSRGCGRAMSSKSITSRSSLLLPFQV